MRFGIANASSRLAHSAWFGMVFALMSVTIAAPALAEPNMAMYDIALAQQDYSISNSNFRQGQSYANIGRADLARPLFIHASNRAYVMSANLSVAVMENRDSWVRGLYRNAVLQQQAVAYCEQAYTHTIYLRAYLQTKVNYPLSSPASVNSYLYLLSISLAQCADATRRAQL